MKSSLNPAYEKAFFELSLVQLDGKPIPDSYPHRFNETPPDDVWGDSDKFSEWVFKHSIPKFIVEP